MNIASDIFTFCENKSRPGDSLIVGMLITYTGLVPQRLTSFVTSEESGFEISLDDRSLMVSLQSSESSHRNAMYTNPPRNPNPLIFAFFR